MVCKRQLVVLALVLFALRASTASDEKDDERDEDDKECGFVCEAVVGAAIHLVIRLLLFTAEAMVASNSWVLCCVGAAIIGAIMVLTLVSVWVAITESVTPREQRKRRANMTGAVAAEALCSAVLPHGR